MAYWFLTQHFNSCIQSFTHTECDCFVLMNIRNKMLLNKMSMWWCEGDLKTA